MCQSSLWKAAVADGQIDSVSASIAPAAQGESVTTVQRAHDTEGVNREPESFREVGRRHRSAYRFCKVSRGAMAVVVQQDGQVGLYVDLTTMSHTGPSGDQPRNFPPMLKHFATAARGARISRTRARRHSREKSRSYSRIKWKSGRVVLY